MKFRLQSLNDVVTNSSMEVYQEATQYTVDEFLTKNFKCIASDHERVKDSDGRIVKN